jgi:hypothetical protein
MKGKRSYRVRRFGIISKILYFFVDSPLTPLLAAGAILLMSTVFAVALSNSPLADTFLARIAHQAVPTAHRRRG